MAKREVFDCDGCKAKDVPAVACIVLFLPRKSGEMDHSYATVHFCPKCSGQLLTKMFQSINLSVLLPSGPEAEEALMSGFWRNWGL